MDKMNEMEKSNNKDQHIISSMIFPPIIAFSNMLFLSNVRIDQHEHYIKRSSRNRYSILSPNGPQCLSIPLKKGKNSRLAMIDVKIAYETNWQIKHLRSIITAYGSAPFFPDYIDYIKDIFSEKHEKLITLNSSTFHTITELMNIPKKTIFTSRYYEKDDLNVVLCRDAHHPSNYNDPNEMYLVESYEQVFTDRFDFVQNLSILDLLFCLGPESGSYLSRVFDAQKMTVYQNVK